jgi:hypothetical protein
MKWDELSAVVDGRHGIALMLTFYGNQGSSLGKVIGEQVEREAQRLEGILRGKFLCLENPAHNMQPVRDICDGELILACSCRRRP